MPDRDRIEGAAEDPGGNVMDAAGKVIGDQLLKAEGRAERVEGKISNSLGGLKDTPRDDKRNQSHVGNVPTPYASRAALVRWSVFRSGR